jgi:alkanesulfonate monooxygenase SsuD/methylene tetrahydromethanopterin reductase-like flavin-dependent oxidoreductase (luciferase family)
MGYAIMGIPMAAQKLRESIDAYRDAWRAAGHPGRGEVMLAFHMFVDEDGERARCIAKPNLEGYFASLISAGKEWTQGMTSTDYQGYDKKYEHLAAQTLETMIESGAALIGTPAEVCAQLERLSDRVGGFDHASLQVNFHRLEQAECRRSMELFGAAVIPRFHPAAALAIRKVSA